MTIPTNSHAATTAPIDPMERDALLAGLTEVKRRGLSVRHGPRTGGKATVRVQLKMTALEFKMLQTMKHVAGFTVGRPISSALTMRVALGYLMKACTAALNDPASAEKMKHDIAHAREERLGDHGKATE
jgi:hypothetical protein